MSKAKPQSKLSASQQQRLLDALKERFEGSMARHRGLKWASVESKLEANPGGMWSLNEMERPGGEPDVMGQDKISGEFEFIDCSAETPKGRISICYDQAALESRKNHKPKSSALAMATEMGIEVLRESQYRELQKLGEFDLKTSSWVQTPVSFEKRKLER